MNFTTLWLKVSFHWVFLDEELLQNISLTTVDLDMIKKSDSDLTQKDFYLGFWFYWDWNKSQSPPAWLSWMQLTYPC